MAFSKHYLYLPSDQLIGNYAHAFSHAARIQIIRQLLKNGPIPVHIIARDHLIHRVSLSDHLKILRELHLVEAKERFPYTFYSIEPETLEKARINLTLLIDAIKT